MQWSSTEQRHHVAHEEDAATVPVHPLSFGDWLRIAMSSVRTLFTISGTDSSELHSYQQGFSVFVR